MDYYLHLFHFHMYYHPDYVIVFVVIEGGVVLLLLSLYRHILFDLFQLICFCTLPMSKCTVVYCYHTVTFVASMEDLWALHLQITHIVYPEVCLTTFYCSYSARATS